MSLNNRRRVVVTGIGAITPLALSAEESWQRILRGESGAGRITLFSLDEYPLPVQIAAEVKGFELNPFLADAPLNPDVNVTRNAVNMDRSAQFALAATAMALKDSSLNLSLEDRSRIGVSIGTGIGGERTRFKNQAILHERGFSKVSGHTIPGTMPNESVAEIAASFGIVGWNLAITLACASGAFAIGEGAEIIKRGDADVVLAGGTESPISPLDVAAFLQIRALSKRNNEPYRASRPFDNDRDGFVIAEGAGILVLEELEHAKARNAGIYGELLGYGVTCDAYSIVRPDPSAEQVERAMRLAIEKSGKDPNAVDYINPHGTSTLDGDRAETRGIRNLFRGFRLPLISSTKSETGHMIGAAGAVELIVCLLAMRDSVVPPTINLENPDPNCTLGELDFVPNQARHIVVDVALSNSFGFGGHNASLLVARYRP